MNEARYVASGAGMKISNQLWIGCILPTQMHNLSTSVQVVPVGSVMWRSRIIPVLVDSSIVPSYRSVRCVLHADAMTSSGVMLWLAGLLVALQPIPPSSLRYIWKQASNTWWYYNGTNYYFVVAISNCLNCLLDDCIADINTTTSYLQSLLLYLYLLGVLISTFNTSKGENQALKFINS